MCLGSLAVKRQFFCHYLIIKTTIINAYPIINGNNVNQFLMSQLQTADYSTKVQSKP